MSETRKISIVVLGTAMAGLLAKLAEHPEIAKDVVVIQGDLEAFAQEQSALIEDYQLQITEAETIIGDLKTQLASAMERKAAANPKPTIKIDEVTYVINHGSAPYTAGELASREDICRELLAIDGQNALTKL